MNKTFTFGKKSKGELSIFNLIALFPYFLFIWIVWRFSLIFDKSEPFNQLTKNIWIGRRILKNEEIQGIDLVIDLTCEFSESMNLVKVNEYWSFPILDGGIPEKNEFINLLKYLESFSGKVYIHCAQGSGRTGLVACGYLLFTGKANTFEEAYYCVKSKRPSVKLNSNQIDFLKCG